MITHQRLGLCALLCIAICVIEGTAQYPSCYKQKCAGLGDRCGIAVDDNAVVVCDTIGAVCTGHRKGRCVALVGDGKPEAGSECDINSTFRNGYCYRKGKKNEGCQEDSECDAFEEGGHLRCTRDSICHYKADVGERCEDHRDCPYKSYCYKDPSVLGLGICKELPKLGESCAKSNACDGFLLKCSDEVCQYKYHSFGLHERGCDTSIDCRQGLVCHKNTPGSRGICVNDERYSKPIYCSSPNDCPDGYMCLCNKKVGEMICAPIPTSDELVKALNSEFGKDGPKTAREWKLYKQMVNTLDKDYWFNYCSAAPAITSLFVVALTLLLL